ncbi:helix-turn-helix domain-containing protein [Neobacillus kokaensis]|uniref:XRE family transcriptional regulator n=1 Tax=Neobacillus kokaensis TaxID=2759023 RepID=A0ABQ3MYW3_9BACI|nr:helix-turn-helix domain-containing protein [Neobacillus kokaensis]GHH96592.1 XRE family transcriptional regulator [Neobacillus kokaensis]
MTELGNRLKEARLAQNLSLDDLQSITKIQKRYLIGIEEGNYSSMPGNFYVRAFIKQYAEALELNPDEIFETYKNEIPASHNEELPQQLSRVKTHKALTEGNAKIFDILPKILIGVFVIGVAGVIYYFASNNTGSDTNETRTQETEPVKVENNIDKAKANETKPTEQKNQEKDNAKGTSDEETTKTAEEEANQALTVVNSQGRKSTFELKNAEKFVVKVVSTGETWVSIRNGKGKSFFSGMLKKGSAESQEIDFSSEKEAYIVVGRAYETDIFVNDQKLEYAADPSKQVRQDITIQYVPKNE